MNIKHVYGPQSISTIMGKMNIRGEWACLNGQKVRAEEVEFGEDGTIIYEVVRFEQGVPLFLEDHYQRLNNSAQKLGFQLQLEYGELKTHLLCLLAQNQFLQGNTLIRVNLDQPTATYLCHFIPHTYPVAFDYSYGVCLGLLHAERPNPEAKVLNLNVREQANQLIRDGQYFEVLLVDKEGQITEGSRSNFLLFKGNEIFTSSPEKILTGVTLKKIFEICDREAIKVNTGCVSENRLGEFDAACITGTSPRILPVSTIGMIGYDVKQTTLQRLMKLYDDEIEQYIHQKQTE